MIKTLKAPNKDRDKEKDDYKHSDGIKNRNKFHPIKNYSKIVIEEGSKHTVIVIYRIY